MSASEEAKYMKEIYKRSQAQMEVSEACRRNLETVKPSDFMLELRNRARYGISMHALSFTGKDRDGQKQDSEIVNES
jgi:hypothetical protein